MIVNYQELKKTIDTNSFILALVNKNHWFLKSFDLKSVYFGYWVIVDDNVYKLIQDINFSEEIKSIEILDEKSAIIKCANNNIKLFLDAQGLVIESEKPTFISIDIDYRILYSNKINQSLGKIIFQENKYILVYYLENEEISCEFYYEGMLKFLDKNFEIFYDYDKKRNSSFLYNKIFKSFEGYVTYLKIYNSDKKTTEDLLIPNYKSKFKNFLIKRVFSLFNFNNGFLAGLPWFSQRWFRDELITLLFFDKKLENIKKQIIENYLENLEEVYLLNKKDGILAADTFLLIVNNLDDDLVNMYKNKLIKYLENWNSVFNMYKDSLPAKSTWMDTIERKRAIEIDFLYYNVLLKLNLNLEAKKFKTFLKSRIKSDFYEKEEFLRPNWFFCYFLNNNFFEREEWESIFYDLIKNNFLKWGGFSSLSFNHKNFQNYYTGEDPSSYHQGDSWFWINNLSIFSLLNLDFKKYKKIISKLKSATLKNLLFKGALGYISELSSAKMLEAEGSPIQLWSLSSLILILDKKFSFNAKNK
jgi:hypothetical protein